MPAFTVRAATPDDVASLASVYRAAFAGVSDPPLDVARAGNPVELELMQQTGSAFVLAEFDGRVVGSVRWWQDEGIAWFDLLASALPGAGKALTRAVDQRAQDYGLRLVRTAVPDTGILPDAFARWGYLPISRVRGTGFDELTLEKRVPLLTVREQRRTDAAAIAELAGLDPWPFEQGTRPGWFVLADGDRLAGVTGVRDLKGGAAEITSPVLAPGYEGRNLDLWMLERAATYAETNGFHSITTAATAALRSRERDLEDRRWFLEDDTFRKQPSDRTIEVEPDFGFDD